MSEIWTWILLISVILLVLALASLITYTTAGEYFFLILIYVSYILFIISIISYARSAQQTTTVNIM